jgi:hypothetical protein
MNKMVKNRSLLQRLGILAIMVGILGYLGSQGVQALDAMAEKQRADIIEIDALKVFGKLERPTVTFLHNAHTDAMEEKSKDCTACHLPDKTKNRLSAKYMRLEDTNKKAVMDIYHANCIECHKATQKAGEKSGPVECGNCHKKSTDLVSNWQPIGLDKSLHYRHSKAQQEKCEQCHHAYNEKEKKLFYDKGKEGTCRYCHKSETEENRISFRKASHIACIDCHREILLQKKIAGPIECNGCHNPEDQKLIEVVKEIPRMKRQQPNTVFVKTSTANNAAIEPRMNAVPFSHQAHEGYNNNCRVCHHASLSACSECHTLLGSDKGQLITLEKSMHDVNSEQSCMGCHARKQKDKSCAGCHTFIPRTSQSDEASCKTCHMGPQPSSEESPESALNDALAEKLLSARKPVMGTYSDADIPEEVTIKILQNEYEAAKLPHRKIVHSLMNKTKEDRIAQYFHTDPGTLCQGCHHNSPAMKKPPACGSCHAKPFDANNILRPGLMAAYHRQCIGCHEEMGIEKPAATDCTGCHKKKNK